MRRGRNVLLTLALVAGFVAPSSGAEAATLRASSITLTASSTTVKVGEEVTLRVTAPRGRFLAKDPVVFERQSGATWVKVASGRLDAAGRATTRARPSAGSTSFRVSKRATRKFRATVSKVTVVKALRSPSTIQLVADSPTTLVGSSASLSAEAVPGSYDATDVVVLQRRLVDGTWTDQATDDLGDDGTIVFSVPTRLGETSYRALKRQTDRFEATTSSRVVLVGQAVTDISLSADTSVIAVGEPVRLTGSTTPRFTHGIVRLLARAADGTSELVREGLLSSDGTFRFDLTPAVGEHTYVVELDARTDGKFASGRSTPVSVTVSGAGPGVPPLLTVNGPGRPMTLGGAQPDTTASFVVEPGIVVAIGLGRLVGLDGLPASSIVVRDPLGGAVEVRPSSSGAKASRWTFTPALGGMYTVEVQAPSSTNGRFDLVVTTPLDHTLVANGADALMSSVGRPGRELRATFTGTRGAYVSIASSSAKDWADGDVRLRDLTTGATVAPVAARQVTPIWQLPRAGDYRLEQEPPDAQTRSARLRVTSTDTVNDIEVNGATTEVSIDRPGALRIYRIDTPPGIELAAAFRYRDVLTDDGRIYNSGYRAFFVQPDVYTTTSGAPNDRVLFGALDDGPVYVILQGPNGSTPTFRLDVTRPDRRDIIPGGATIAFSSEDRAGQEFQADFEASAGEYVSMGQSDVVHGPANEGRTRMPAVGLVEAGTDAPVDSSAGHVWRIPHDGQYRLRIVPNAAFTSSFDVTMSSTRPVPLAPNGVSPVLSFEREGEARVFSVEPESGARVAAAITAAEDADYWDYSAYVLAGSTHVIGPGDRANWTGDSRPDIIVARGTTRQSGAAPARLDVSTPSHLDVSPNAGPVRMSTGSYAGREMTADFHAAAGDWISYAITDTESWSVERVELVYEETGAVVGRLEGWSGSDVLNIWSAPRDGAYRLRFVPKRGTTMSADVYVSRTTPTPIDVDGPWQAARIEKPGDLAVYTFSASKGQPLVLGTALSTFQKLDGSADFGRLFITRDRVRPLVRDGTRPGAAEVQHHVTPDATGMWTVVISTEASGSTGRLDLRVRQP